MKTILVFTNGDANDPKTWSNVPYLFTKTLEEKGFKVIKIDMSTRRTLFALLYSGICKIIRPCTTYYWYRSAWNRHKVEKKIKAAVEKYDDEVDLYISISFDFSPSKFTQKRVLLLSDWPLEYALEKRLEHSRKPDFFERRDIRRHREVIESATYRVSLFQDVAEYMNKHFSCETKYLGLHINSFVEPNSFKLTSGRNKITFIGKNSYKDAGIELIKAYNGLDQELKNKFELHFIGMNMANLHISNSDNNTAIFCHGYLDKGNKTDCKKYYDILKTTRVIVNTCKKWAGMSSILESLYLYRPIITSPFDEFINTFGKNIDFGYFCADSVDLAETLRKALTLDEKTYSKMSLSAHDVVKDFTYSNFVDKVIAYCK